ncbi:MAG: transketolase, partial [Simkania negevensis]|nr:transketolase [Simkania negevensis]
GVILRHNPKEASWINRDRVVLSAGHGSMWLYSCLHLAGFPLTLEDIKEFRQLHSKTPGHPEYWETPGVEATTGPLGQGVASAVGQALGLKILASKFNTPEHQIIDAKVFCLAGDGCLMEGVSNEASSFAGHLCLDNLILIHDANRITLDGPLEQSCSEDVRARYKAYGFETYEMDGNHFESIETIMKQIGEKQTKPIFITCHTIIGKGSPHKAGTYKVHGSPLGVEEVKATKEALGLPEEPFYIPQQVKTYFEERRRKEEELYEKWKKQFTLWEAASPELAATFHAMGERKVPADLEEKLKKLEIPAPISGRKASEAILEFLGNLLPYFYGGSADLSGSDCTLMKQFPLIASKSFKGRNIKFGIREFAMAGIASGLWQTGMFRPFIGTFLTFSDYMRNAIRLAALSKIPIIYQFTHDSIFLGEDGPTHQPVEHLAALRAMPKLQVMRPADANEVKGSWIAALSSHVPTAIVLSRQNLPLLKGTDLSYKKGVGRGAYILHKEKGKVDFTLFATGSEVSLAIDVAEALEKLSKQVRVISIPCWEMFERQDKEYKESVIGGNLGKRVSIEAGVSFGWHRWIGEEGVSICIEDFGLSAPMGDLANEFGFTVDAIISRLLSSTH